MNFLKCAMRLIMIGTYGTKCYIKKKKAKPYGRERKLSKGCCNGSKCENFETASKQQKFCSPLTHLNINKNFCSNSNALIKEQRNAAYIPRNQSMQKLWKIILRSSGQLSLQINPSGNNGSVRINYLKNFSKIYLVKLIREQTIKENRKRMPFIPYIHPICYHFRNLKCAISIPLKKSNSRHLAFNLVNKISVLNIKYTAVFFF